MRAGRGWHGWGPVPIDNRLTATRSTTERTTATNGGDERSSNPRSRPLSHYQRDGVPNIINELALSVYDLIVHTGDLFDLLSVVSYLVGNPADTRPMFLTAAAVHNLPRIVTLP